MNITDIITNNAISIDLEVKNKQELLEYMIDLISKSPVVINKDEAAKEIYVRESIMSTGIGKGIALPHAKTNSVTAGIGAFAVLKKPIEFDSLDGKPVDIVFMLLGKENDISGHLRLLSKISRIMNDNNFRDNVRKIKNPQEIIDYLQSKVDKF
jgi:fructose-specific phosphotransferase system IIA component